MYDYMKALQERFDKKPPERLVRAVQSAREEVREGMDDEKRKKLLRLLDAQKYVTGGGHAAELYGGLQAGMGHCRRTGSTLLLRHR